MHKSVSTVLGLCASLAMAGGVAIAQTPPPSERGAPTAPTSGPFVPGGPTDERVGRPAIVQGKVGAIEADVIVLEIPRTGGPGSERATDGNPLPPPATRIRTDANTAFYVPGVANPNLSNVKVGDRIAALVNRQGTGGQPTLLALGVTVYPVPQHVVLIGQVADLSPTSFKLQGRAGIVIATVNLVPSTKIIVPGQPSGALADGQTVAVRAKPLGNDTIEAEIVLVRPGDRANSLGGFVAAVAGNTIVVWTQRGESVSVDASSAVFARPGESLADIRVGEMIRVYGIWNGAKTAMVAQLIGELGGATPGPPGPRTAATVNRTP